MTTKHTLPFLLLLLAAGAASLASGAGARSFRVDPKASKATIEVGKSGAFSFAAGHSHEVAGPVSAGDVSVDLKDVSRSHVRIEIDAAALKVTGKGESPDDVPKVQQTMAGDEVLDVRRYPRIRFESTSVSVKSGAPPALDLAVAGNVTLHGVTKSVTVPVAVKIDANSVTATGRFAVKQSEFGIKPVSVGGVVSVKDTLDVRFTIVARSAGARESDGEPGRHR